MQTELCGILVSELSDVKSLVGEDISSSSLFLVSQPATQISTESGYISKKITYDELSAKFCNDLSIQSIFREMQELSNHIATSSVLSCTTAFPYILSSMHFVNGGLVSADGYQLSVGMAIEFAKAKFKDISCEHIYADNTTAGINYADAIRPWNAALAVQYGYAKDCIVYHNGEFYTSSVDHNHETPGGAVQTHSLFVTAAQGAQVVEKQYSLNSQPFQTYQSPVYDIPHGTSYAVRGIAATGYSVTEVQGIVVSDVNATLNTTANTYQVGFNSCGGSAVTTIKYITFGTAYGEFPTAPTKDGYQFAGWHLDQQYETLITETSLLQTASNHVLYAKWQALPRYSVTVASNNISYGTASSSAASVLSGSQVTCTATAKAGYEFDGWNNGLTSNPYTATVNSDLALTANFTAVQTPTFTITLSSNDTTLGTVEGAGTYASGTVQTIKAIPAEDCTFVRWLDNNNYPAERQVTVTADAMYVAVFQSVHYSIVRSLGTVCTTDKPNQTTVEAGTSHTETLEVLEGSLVNPTCTMDGVPVPVTPINPTASSARKQLMSTGNSPQRYGISIPHVSGDIFINAVQLYSIQLSADPISCGTVNGAGTYVKDSLIMIEAVPDKGCVLAHWNDGNTQARRQVVVSADALYTATFTRGTCNLTLSVNNPAYGTTTPAPGTHTVASGRVHQLNATPNSGYAFDHWDNGYISRKCSVTTTEDLTCTAYFKQSASGLADTHIICTDGTEVVMTPQETAYAGDTTTTKVCENGTLTQNYLDCIPNGISSIKEILFADRISYLLSEHIRNMPNVTKVTMPSYVDFARNSQNNVTFNNNPKLTVLSCPNSFTAENIYWSSASQLNSVFAFTPLSAVYIDNLNTTLYFPVKAMKAILFSEQYGRPFGSSQCKFYVNESFYFDVVKYLDTQRVLESLDDRYLSAYIKVEGKPCAINVITNSTKNGTTVGTGCYVKGQTVTIAANPNVAEGISFKKWSDGDYNNPRTVVATDDYKEYTAIWNAPEINAFVSRDGEVIDYKTSELSTSDTSYHPLSLRYIKQF